MMQASKMARDGLCDPSIPKKDKHTLSELKWRVYKVKLTVKKEKFLQIKVLANNLCVIFEKLFP